MDKQAIFEIERAIKRAKARVRKLPLSCDCLNEMEVRDGYAVCLYCKKVVYLDPKEEVCRRTCPLYRMYGHRKSFHDFFPRGGR